ncbi:MAG: glycosyltransferase [Candidatus Margulisbacteria bacterium]|nr:glycosyltransferase [Candidatus Margulisiibacteriota bacterium]
MKKIRVAQVVNQLSIGGTEKTIEVFANNLDKDLFEVSIYALFSGGARYDRFKQNFKTYVLNGNFDAFVHHLKENHIDIMHIHRSGYEEPFAIHAAREAGVPIIVETKIFGAVDKSSSGRQIDASIFISKMCALRFMNQTHLSTNDFFKKNIVIYNPIEINKYQIPPAEVAAFKRSLGILPGEFVLGRVSRADPFKFGNVCLKMMPYLLTEVPNVKYIIVGCPPSKLEMIKRLKLSNNVITLPEIDDERQLAVFYESLDLYAYAAYHGESFGITLAEAMAHRKPVIVNSTPAIDNAQVELVDHGETGFIANWPFNYAQAVASILKDKVLKKQLGEKGFQKADRLYNAKTVTRQLEQLYLNLCRQKGLAVPDLNIKIKPDQVELEHFRREYPVRKRQQFNKFSVLGLAKGLSRRVFFRPPIVQPKLSVLLIALNEADLIEKWLNHVSRLNPYEIVIVDGGSTDGTVEKIKHFPQHLNIKLIQQPMGGSFSAQRNLALKNCSGDWVLALDADELLTEKGLELIPALMNDNSSLAFSFPRLLLFPDDRHFSGDLSGDLQLRLFRNLPEIEYIHEVHERPAYKGKEIHPGIVNWKWCKIKRAAKILHYGYIKSRAALIEKGKRWQLFKAASEARGLNIGGEDFFILDENKMKVRSIEEIK